MNYMLKQKFFSFGDSFTVQDENGNDVYWVEGKIFSFGDKLTFSDNNGRELIYIEQKLFSWGPTYEIYVNGSLYATVKKELFTFFKCVFDIQLENSESFEVEGDFFDHDYNFMRNGSCVANVTKEWLSWSDRYGIQIAEGQNDVFILACVVIIDMICHNEKNK